MRSLLSHLLFATLATTLLTLTPQPAAAQTSGPESSPTDRFPSLQPIPDLTEVILPEANLGDLKEEAPSPAAPSGAKPIRPYAYGVTVDAGFTPETTGAWEKAESDLWVWRLPLRSRDAVSVSVAFSEFDLPDGARVYLRSPSGDRVHGPYTAEDATRGEHRTPLVEGEVAVVELVVPAARRDDVRLRVGHVVHGYRSVFERPIPGSNQKGVPQKDGACNVDVMCPEADDWYPMYRSVAAYTFEVGSQAFVCSGSLVNNTSENRRPLFLTAEHCVNSQEQVASMVFYWNYESPLCRNLGTQRNANPPFDDRGEQTSSGAMLLARYGNVHVTGDISGRPDLSLVEIDDVIPESYGLYFAGWDVAATDPSQTVTVHHPNGDAKRISIDDDGARRSPYAANTRDTDGTHWYVDGWELGTTEGGSSGSPLFNEDKRVIGVLSGGAARCEGQTANDNDQPDWYGSLARGFTEGDYENRTFRDVLDPAGTGAQSMDGLFLAPDPEPPAQVSDLRVRAATTDSITLAWTAPGDDGMTGTAYRYDIAVSSQPIETIREFNDADLVRRRGRVPAPAEAGTPQSAAYPVELDSTYYFALRTMDDAGRVSSIKTLSNEAGTPVGVAPVRELRIAVQPNPTDGSGGTNLQIRSPIEGEVSIEIYDALGRRVRDLGPQVIQSGRELFIPLNMTSLASGMYFIRTRIGDEERFSQVSLVR